MVKTCETGSENKLQSTVVPVVCGSSEAERSPPMASILVAKATTQL